MRRLILPLLSAFLLTGCSLFEDESVFDISTGGAAISVQNVSDQTVSYLAVESKTATRFDLGDPAEWATFEPGAGYHGPADGFAIGFDSDDTEFLLYWSTGDGIHHERVRP